jgi:hypothetical protein
MIVIMANPRVEQAIRNDLLTMGASIPCADHVNSFDTELKRP